MYVALPKNELGTLEPAAVRYILHRYFVQKHGWYVKGLEPAGQSWNSTSPTSILTSRVPAFIQSLFEQSLHGEGMSLHEVAVFAATLSDFIDLYDALNISSTMPAKSSAGVDPVIRGYVLQLLDGTTKIRNWKELQDLEQGMRAEFPSWTDLKLWVEDVRKTISSDRAQRRFDANEFSFGRVVEEVQELNDRLGAFQDLECRSIKTALADMAFRNAGRPTGRVLLSDFYREGLNGKFLF